MKEKKNLKTFKWAPPNLLRYLNKTNWKTFNNVASGILNGKKNINAYKDSLKKKPKEFFWVGWLKGFALKKTGQIIGTKYLILIDNDPRVLEGILQFSRTQPNPTDFSTIPGGFPASNPLSLNSFQKKIYL